MNSERLSAEPRQPLGRGSPQNGSVDHPRTKASRRRMPIRPSVPTRSTWPPQARGVRPHPAKRRVGRSSRQGAGADDGRELYLVGVGRRASRVATDPVAPPPNFLAPPLPLQRQSSSDTILPIVVCLRHPCRQVLFLVVRLFSFDSRSSFSILPPCLSLTCFLNVRAEEANQDRATPPPDGACSSRRTTGAGDGAPIAGWPAPSMARERRCPGYSPAREGRDCRCTPRLRTDAPGIAE